MGTTRNIVGQSGEKGRKAAQILERWRYLLNAEYAGTNRILIGLEVTDTGERLGLELRNSILELHRNGLPFTPV